MTRGHPICPVAWLLSAGLAAAACAAAEPAVRGAVSFGPGTRDADGRYHNEGFSILFPPEWELREDVPGMVALGISPQEGPGDRFLENCGLAVEGIDREVDLETYRASALAYLQRSAPGFVLLHREDTFTYTGIPAKKIVYEQESGELALRMLVYLVVAGDRAFIITCGTGQQAFENHQRQFERIAKSFQIESLD